MKDYKLKLQHIVLTFIKVNVCTILFYLIFYLVFVLELEIPLKDNLTNFFIPAGLAAVSMLIWVRPELKLLIYENERYSILTYIVCIGCMLWLMITSASWLTIVTNPLIRLNKIEEMQNKPYSKYYKIDDYNIFINNTTSSYTLTRSGKNNEYINLDIYFTAPFRVKQTSLQNNHKYWIVKKYHQQESSRLNDAALDKSFDLFAKVSERNFLSGEYRYTINHFIKTSNSDESIQAVEAIRKIYPEMSEKNMVILSPDTKDLHDEEKKAQKYTIISFFTGIAALMILLIFPKFNSKKKATTNKQEFRVIISAILSPKRNEVFCTTTLIIINIIVFIILLVFNVDIVNPSSAMLYKFGGVTYSSVYDGELWRLITNIFVHAGLMHLIYNMIGLALAGICLERLLSRTRFLLLYILTGIVAAIVSILRDKHAILVGASGAIFGLFGALLIQGLLSKDKALLSMVGVYAGISLFIGFITPGTGNIAHVTGLISGILIYLIVRKRKQNR